MLSPLVADLVARLGAPSQKTPSSAWVYSTAGGVATLCRGDDFPLKKLGRYASESLARKACDEHFQKAKRGLLNLGKQLPSVHYV